MKLSRLAFGAILAASVVAGGYFWLLEPAQPIRAAESPAPRRGAPVTTAIVVERAVPVTIEAIGLAEAFSTVAVKSRVAGQILSTAFREGQVVAKGDLLFKIDPAPYEAEVLKAEATLARDRAQLESARADLSRYERLSRSGYSSEQQYEQARANAKALEATLKADEALLQLARLQLEYTSVRSPIEGRTGSILVHPGNIVGANDTTLVVINETRPIHVAFSVPEEHLLNIKRRMAAGPISVEASVPGQTSPEVGQVSFIDNAVDASTGTIRIKADFQNSKDTLTPGQFVTVSVTLDVLENALVVPSEAVQQGQAGPYVYVVRGDQTVEVRSVVPGPSTDGVTVLKEGVATGEQVVTQGQLRLVPGAKVEAKPAGSS